MKVWTTEEWLSRRVTNNHTLNQTLYGLFIQELQKRPDSKAYRYVWALASSHPTSWRKPWSRIWSEEALVKGCQAALFPSEITCCVFAAKSLWCFLLKTCLDSTPLKKAAVGYGVCDYQGTMTMTMQFPSGGLIKVYADLCSLVGIKKTFLITWVSLHQEIWENMSSIVFPYLLCITEGRLTQFYHLSYIMLP